MQTAEAWPRGIPGAHPHVRIPLNGQRTVTDPRNCRAQALPRSSAQENVRRKKGHLLNLWGTCVRSSPWRATPASGFGGATGTVLALLLRCVNFTEAEESVGAQEEWAAAYPSVGSPQDSADYSVDCPAGRFAGRN